MVKFIETKSRLVVARVWGEGEMLNGHGVLLLLLLFFAFLWVFFPFFFFNFTSFSFTILYWFCHIST